MVVPFERTNTNEVVTYEEKEVIYTTLRSKSFVD